MVSRKYPHLVVGDAPTMDIEPLRGRRRRTTGWLAVCSFALLLGAGVTASLISTPPEPKKKKPAVTSTAQPPPADAMATAPHAKPAVPLSDVDDFPLDIERD